MLLNDYITETENDDIDALVEHDPDSAEGIDAMADAIYAIVKYPAMYKSLHELGMEEVNNIKWYDAGLKVRAIYDKVINHR